MRLNSISVITVLGLFVSEGCTQHAKEAVATTATKVCINTLDDTRMDDADCTEQAYPVLSWYVVGAYSNIPNVGDHVTLSRFQPISMTDAENIDTAPRVE